MSSDDLYIGVCGHKDILTPKQDIARALTLFWSALQKKTGKSSFHLLDSLAEGGDQYVLDSRPDFVPYTAVLPFDAEIYAQDFGSPEAGQLYRDSLKGASSVITAGNEPGNYVHASEYLLEHSGMILALWDCVVTEGAPAPGGSFDTITKALANALPVIVIPARRRKTYPNIKQDLFPEECIPFNLNPDLSFERFSD